jgi:hypothetical protein
MTDPFTRSQAPPAEDLPAPPVLGAEGEPCPACGAPLAADQRYCLNCGRRRAGARVPYADLLAGRAPEDVLTPVSAPPPPPPPPEPRRGIPVGIAAGAAGVVVLILALGVLLGAATSDEEQPRQVAAPVRQAPPVINVNAAPAGTEDTTEEFVSDWPEGEEGFTVQLETLDKASSDVAAVDQAKSDAEAAGATEVGALDSDEWVSLDAGQYVIYSGVFTGKSAKADAQKALKGLKKDFPDAKVVEVSAGDIPGAEGTKPEEKVQEVDEGELEELQNATGEEQQKKSAELPPTLGTGGEPPPEDDKQGGGGSGFEVID